MRKVIVSLELCSVTKYVWSQHVTNYHSWQQRDQTPQWQNITRLSAFSLWLWSCRATRQWIHPAEFVLMPAVIWANFLKSHPLAPLCSVDTHQSWFQVGSFVWADSVLEPKSWKHFWTQKLCHWPAVWCWGWHRLHPPAELTDHHKKVPHRSCPV